MVRSPNIGSSATGPPLPSKGVVLLVEDESSVRTLLRRMLEIHSLTVLAVESPEDAIAVSISSEDPIDVLLTDLQLPGMSGMELAVRVRELRPSLPVVFMSGYPRDVAFGCFMREFSKEEFLQKPFTPAQLGETIRRALTAPPPPSSGDTMKM